MCVIASEFVTLRTALSSGDSRMKKLGGQLRGQRKK